MTLVEIAAVTAVALLVLIIGFQVALALGAPFGKAAWGGQHDGVLPTRLRLASGVTGLLIYPLIATAILGSADLIDVELLSEKRGQLMWAFVGLFTLGTIANLVSRSTVERYWAGVSFAIAVCCGVIASAL